MSSATAAGGADGLEPTSGRVAGAEPLPVTEPGSLPRSVLLAAVPLMSRTASLAVPAIVITAAVQAALMFLDVASGFSPAFLASFAVSALATLVLYGLLSACALEAVDHGRIPAPEPAQTSSAAAQRRTRAHAGPFALWIAAQWLVLVALSVISPWLIAVVAVLTPFLPLAAIDGCRSAAVVNFRVIGQRLGRWLITSALLLVLGLVLFLLSVANTLFAKGTPAAVLFWLAIGVVAWWLLTAWALIYRSTPGGHRRG